MKFLGALLSALALCQNGNAFSIQQGAAVRPATSSLKMTVEENPTKNVRVGVIGCGRIGLVHLEAITKAPGVVPVIVSNPTVSKAEKGTFFFKFTKIDCGWSYCFLISSLDLEILNAILLPFHYEQLPPSMAFPDSLVMLWKSSTTLKSMQSGFVPLLNIMLSKSRPPLQPERMFSAKSLSPQTLRKL